MNRMPESLARSYADSLAGASPVDAALIKAEFEYVSLLHTHDWRFEVSEDQVVYQRGLAEEHRLYVLQADVDPYLRLWNKYAPLQYQRKPVPKAA